MTQRNGTTKAAQSVPRVTTRAWGRGHWLAGQFFISLLITVSLGNQPVVRANDLERAQQLYKLCAACHEQDGRGNQQRNAPALAGLESWYVEAQLHKFRAGQRGYHADDVAALQMRPMARALQTDTDVQAMAAYVATLSPTAPVATLTGDIERGKNLYTTCSACHGPDGKGNEAVKSPALLHQPDWYLVSQLKKFRTGLRGAHKDDVPGMQMRAMTMMLQDDQALNDIAAYVLTLKK